MSDHDDTLNTGYSTPVPELDDHRYQSASVQKEPRSRRGTAGSMFTGSPGNPDLSLVNEGLLHTIARDFEHAVIDEEAADPSPFQNRTHGGERSRRGTVTTMDPRSISPPNSVKAFAEARRRERKHSTIDVDQNDNQQQEDCNPLRRTASSTSRRSLRSRRFTNEDDARSLTASVKSEAEEDVCFPLQKNGNKSTLQIDFEGLEEFIAEEESREKTPPKGQPQARVFQDLRPHNACNVPTIITNDGDFVDIPTNGTSLDEKEKAVDAATLQSAANAPSGTDINRFEFFSSEGEEVIHSADFGGLVFPGDNIRSLFTLPEGEEADGVWWLNMNNPTEEEIRAICKAFGVHPLTIEDIGTQEAREKIELFPSYYFACFRSFHVEEIEGGQEYEPFNIYVIVFREGTLSFSFSPNPHANQVRKRITMLKDYVSLSSDWICYALM